MGDVWATRLQMFHILSCLCGSTKNREKGESGRKSPQEKKNRKLLRLSASSVTTHLNVVFKQGRNFKQSCAYKQQRTPVNLISVEICADKPASKTIVLVQNHFTSPPTEICQSSPIKHTGNTTCSCQWCRSEARLRYIFFL